MQNYPQRQALCGVKLQPKFCYLIFIVEPALIHAHVAKSLVNLWQ